MKRNDSEPTQPWWELLKQKAEQLRFGTITIVIHDGRVTQVECLEKTRFDSATRPVS